jgi:hypothetical protein
MREFEAKNIVQRIEKITTINSELLTAKIVSVLAMVYIKYGER